MQTQKYIDVSEEHKKHTGNNIFIDDLGNKKSTVNNQ